MAPRQDHLWALGSTLHFHDETFQVLAVLINFARHLFLWRDRAFNSAQVDMDDSLVSTLLDDTGHHVADLAVEFANDQFIVGFAEPLDDHLSGSASGNTAEAGWRDLLFAK
ncbi:hypothetical protein GALL_398030 [mine drainage metagenome]|uniref:Uncharacterized protein n=1 Tax=mine drainage metagenome TaxID=410659 RepID=A0A1J5QRC3_9ZZZZ